MRTGAVPMAIILFLTIALLYVRVPTRKATAGNMKSVVHRPCGNNAEDAEARGCIFDLGNFSWLPKECVDLELSREFLGSQKEWEFFPDRNKTENISVQEVARGDMQFFIDGRVHMAHCTYTWLHFQKALANGNMIPGQHNLAHANHCGEVLTKHRKDWEEVEIRVKIAFPDCGHYSLEYPA